MEMTDLFDYVSQVDPEDYAQPDFLQRLKDYGKVENEKMSFDELNKPQK